MLTNIQTSRRCEIEEGDPGTGLRRHSSSLLSQNAEVATKILTEVMQAKRSAAPAHRCSPGYCRKCAEPHLPKVVAAVAQGLPVTFVLPAFPGKSPNPAKVLGPLPDMAERRALESLQLLCQRIERYHVPGARVILCADGRVFSDVVGMRDEDVTAYQAELAAMIHAGGLTSVSTFNLDELYEGLSFDHMRTQLMEEHGDRLENLQSAVRNGGKAADCSSDDLEAHRLYCGITRFLFEDALFPGQTKSRTALQREARLRAYDVILRSKAWGALLEERFPNAVRLSIHPQSCGAKKLGIRLIGPDNWMTPWHGVVVEVGGRFTLCKRAQAEELGAHLIHHGGRPSHYVLTDAKQLEKWQGGQYEA